MNILLKPIVTEKMTSQGDKFNRYGFLVAKNANKLQIKKAVEELYGVTVDSVNTMRYSGKVKTRNTKTKLLKGRTAATKGCTGSSISRGIKMACMLQSRRLNMIPTEHQESPWLFMKMERRDISLPRLD